MVKDFRIKFRELEEKINQLNVEVEERVRLLRKRYSQDTYDYLLDTVRARKILLSQAKEYRYNSQVTHGLEGDFEEMAIADLKKAVEITYDGANKIIAYSKSDIDKTILATWGRDGI